MSLLGNLIKRRRDTIVVPVPEPPPFSYPIFALEEKELMRGVWGKAIKIEENSVKLNEKPTNPKDSVGIRKVPFSVLPTPVLAEAALGMLEGALKYGRHNYRAIGVRASVYYDATQRHLTSWWEGEDIDPESQLSHVTKAITSLMVLRDAMIRDMYEDDRPPASGDMYEKLNVHAAGLVDKYADRNPKHYTNKNYKETDVDSK